MSDTPDNSSGRAQIEKIARIADMTCSAHSGLRDRYARLALTLDLLILSSSLWLVALAFVDVTTARSLTPGNLSPQMFIGTLGVITFFLSIVQLKTKWKECADAHARSATNFAAVKREANYALTLEHIDAATHRRVIDRNDMANTVCIPIPEAVFLKQKRRHLLKVALSKHLDTHPAASIVLTRIRWWLRDNRGENK